MNFISYYNQIAFWSRIKRKNLLNYHNIAYLLAVYHVIFVFGSCFLMATAYCSHFSDALEFVAAYLARFISLTR
ncbi:hypothetical protein KL86CLO1_11406 [uncultured Eubacteriales bacterium]|uniref:Uncharacterized protein n=1 Tax=uncultured Eubacteriales bacterium TaxID=172733 RepID=A0A212JNB9_9FIRM|nr:hypothetical protein KL86CLO1_11406 [uncultured Eubacteriales bacterium]